MEQVVSKVTNLVFSFEGCCPRGWNVSGGFVVSPLFLHASPWCSLLAGFALSFSGFGYFIPVFVPYACGARDGLPDSVREVVRSRCKTSE